MLTEKDFEQLKANGISNEYIQWQFARFKEGVPFINLNRAATINDGIKVIENPGKYINQYDRSDTKRIKFVPASGAATRMFKALHEQLGKLKDHQSIKGISELDKPMQLFFTSIEKFAFFDILESYTDEDCDINSLIRSGDFSAILNMVLGESYLDYGNKPKGLIHFHKYDTFSRKAIEEHLVEGALYSRSPDNGVHIHFTVSPEHLDSFYLLIEKEKEGYEEKYNVIYHIDFSVQKSSTNTMAVTPDNEPFREEDGSILFRPAGHGALIENLNELEADIVFIKNIDNVITENRIEPTVKYKKILAGFLIDMQQQIHDLLNKLDASGDDHLKEAIDFVREKLNIAIDGTVNLTEVIELLNRPVRVCGVVKNIGEPGGGPYWVNDKKGFPTLQIVESSQINMENPDQKAIFLSSTHFNPVDIVCGMKDYKGHSFDLKAYIDEETCFISSKSKNGRNLKALELPGLWNGAMSNWISFFIEVPLETFNPVKTVNDLLRNEHQSF